MITMKGKYNFANIFVDELDEFTKEQIQNFLNHPAFGGGYIAIMPDCHAGMGAVIGFTMQMNNYVIPNVVGVDIGCGVLAANLGTKENVNLEAFDKLIHEKIPHGCKIHKQSAWESRLPPSFLSSLKGVCESIEYDIERALKSVGTLGGGNHFIELDRDEQGNLWVLVHSGSRNFGLSVANFYQKRAKTDLAKYFVEDQFKNLEFIPIEKDLGQDYLRAMGVAQQFASTNRFAIMGELVVFLGGVQSTYDEKSSYSYIESVHNYIDLDKKIVRKGAISAQTGERCVIPLNMRDGAVIGTGKGSAKFNFSAPHGAGRVMSRKKAKEVLSVDEFVSGMKDANIFTTTASKNTLDEAPGAYKKSDTIILALRETVDVEHRLRPIYNFKSTE